MKWIANRKWNYPIAHERAYAKELLVYVNSIFRAYKAHFELLEDFILANDIKLDSSDFSQDFIDTINKDIPSFDNMQTIATKYFDLVNSYNRGEFEKVLKSVGLNAVGEERWYKEYSANWINDNLDLIKSVHADTLNSIKRELRESVSSTMTSGARAKYLANRIEKLANTTRNRAALIARDQVGKLNGRVTEYRQRGAGIEEYRWSTSHDSRVRDEHAERDGQIFRWDNPPYDGHPGTPIRCRCVALPVIDFKNLKGQYYTPRSNRQAVSMAIQQFGNPNGVLYSAIVDVPKPTNASPIYEDLETGNVVSEPTTSTTPPPQNKKNTLSDFFKKAKEKDLNFFFGENNYKHVSNKYIQFKRFIDDNNIIIYTNNIMYVKGNPVLVVDNNKVVYLKDWQLKEASNYNNNLTGYLVKLNRNYFKAYTFKSEFDNFYFTKQDTFDDLVEISKQQDETNLSMKV